MLMPRQQFKTNPLLMYVIIYMIMALLFLTSVTLHIHTQESAVAEEHGFAVSISAISGDLSQDVSIGEIVVSPDSALKVSQNNAAMLAVFLLIAVILTVLCRSFIGRMRESRFLLSTIPFHGAPLLRAPPL